jgi:hypothetical protein
MSFETSWRRPATPPARTVTDVRAVGCAVCAPAHTVDAARIPARCPSRTWSPCSRQRLLRALRRGGSSAVHQTATVPHPSVLRRATSASDRELGRGARWPAPHGVPRLGARIVSRPLIARPCRSATHAERTPDVRASRGGTPGAFVHASAATYVAAQGDRARSTRCATRRHRTSSPRPMPRPSSAVSRDLQNPS